MISAAWSVSWFTVSSADCGTAMRALPARFMCSRIEDCAALMATWIGRALFRIVDPAHLFSTTVSRATNRLRRSFSGKGQSASCTICESTMTTMRPFSLR